MRKNNFLYAILPIILFALACGFGSGQKEISTSNPADPPNADTVSNDNYSTKVKIKTTDEKTVVEIKTDGNRTKLEFGGKILRGMLNGEKRKYNDESGGQAAEVKTKDEDGFKVRTPDGKLLWKIKIAADKIKISDNEENQNAFEIHRRDDGAKVELNGQKLGEVKFYRDRQKIKVKDGADTELFDSNTDRYSIGYGVLLLDKIPEEMRYIIIAELLARNL